MGNEKMQFDDGSAMQWVDRESLKYTERGYFALLWIDFESGFLNNGRVLMMESLCHWHEASGGPLEIPRSKQEEIIEKVRKYYGDRPLRLSEDS